VAEYVSKHLLTDAQSILSLTQESPSLGRRILNWLDSLIAKLGNKVSQERTFLLNARNLYAKALFQTQGSFTAETDSMSPAETTAPAATDSAVDVTGMPAAETTGTVAGTEADALRQIVQEQYARGEISEAEFDDMMELIDQQEDESAGIEEQFSIAGESGISLEKKFSDYPYNMQTVLKEYIDAVDDKVLVFVDDVKAGTAHPGDKVDVGIVSKRMAGDILRITGTQMNEGDKILLNTSAVEHVQIRHGLNGKADQSMRNSKDFARINYILQNYDHAEAGKQRNPAYRNRNNTSAKTIMFSKKINGTYYVVEAVTDTGKAGIVSAFINKNGAAQVLDADSPSWNVRNELATTPKDIIGENTENVNEQFSINDQVSKRDVVSDLREILRRGGDPAELRRYVENMERGTDRAAEVESADSQDAEVQDILRAAREQNISVDEHLRRNWEQYEYDGQLNDAARTALDQEKGNVQYSVSDSNQKYDYTVSFAEQVDDYKAGLIPAGDTLLIGATPEVYQSIGFNALPMTINTSHVDYALNGTKDADHFMGETALKQLPESLKNPVAVFVSQTHGTTSIIALLNFTVNGKQTVAPIVIDGFGFQNNIRVDSNAVTSAYGKTTAINQLYQAIKDDAAGKFSLLYINKKEAVSLLQRDGHQLSGRLIPRDGFIHSIRESGSPVKPKFNSVTETQQFKRWFGDWQKHPDKASKIVHQDGSPMVMYHGSPALFTIFDKKKARSSGQYGSGFYFTNSKSHAGTYGQEYSVYLNIRNPLESGRTEVSRRQVETYLNAVAENEDYSIENYGTYDIDTIVETIMGNSNSVDAFKLIQDVNLTAIGDMVEAAELFNQINNTKFDGIVTATETVAFYPEQIKSATDNIGTFDGSNPNIRYSISDDQTTEEGETTSEELPEDPRSGLPRKAQDYLKRTETKLLNDIGEKLSVPELARREHLRPIVQELSNEYLRTGI